MATFVDTPVAVRKGLLPYYPYATGPPIYSMMPGTFPSHKVMREKPTIEKLCLSKLDVPCLLLFREKFVRLAQANYPEEL